MAKKKLIISNSKERNASKSKKTETFENLNSKFSRTKGKHTKGRKKSSEDWKQLDELGLEIFEVHSDGNCCFRSIAHQLEGKQDNHFKLRTLTIDYVEDHEDDFKFFIEDDVPFNDYCENMRKDGMWAGNLELQAISLLTKTNICIHQLDEPRWHLNNFSDSSAPTIHVSYHDGQHYNSLIKKENESQVPNYQISIDDIINDYNQMKSKSNSYSRNENGKKQKGRRKENAVNIINKKNNNESNNNENNNNEYNDSNNNSDGHDDKENDEDEDVDHKNNININVNDNDNDNDGKSNDELVNDGDDGDDGDDKKEIMDGENDEYKMKKEKLLKQEARNKPCACGSKKKYKVCCGSVRNRNVVQISHISTSMSVLSNKERKEKLKNARNNDSKNKEVGKLVHTLGSLCI